MTRDRRSAPQQSPNFVWETLDAQTHDPGAAPGLEREGSPAATETVRSTEGAGSGERMGGGLGELDEANRDGRREPGAHRASRRVLIAAAVLVPLASGSYAVGAYSIRHDDTTVATAQAGQAGQAGQVPGLDAPASSGPGGGRTLGAGAAPAAGSGSGSSAGSSAGSSTGSGRVPGTGASPNPSLPPSANKSATTTAAGPAHVPSQAATTVATTPERSAASSSPAAPKPPATAKPTPTPTKASRPSCAAAWNPNTSYVPGQIVSYQGDDYTATYYSTDAAPNAAISWDVWTSDGSCGS